MISMTDDIVLDNLEEFHEEMGRWLAFLILNRGKFSQEDVANCLDTVLSLVKELAKTELAI